MHLVLPFFLFFLGSHFLTHISSSAVLEASSETRSKELWTCRFLSSFLFFHIRTARHSRVCSHTINDTNGTFSFTLTES